MYSCLTPRFRKKTLTSEDLNNVKLPLTNNEGDPRRHLNRVKARMKANFVIFGVSSKCTALLVAHVNRHI